MTEVLEPLETVSVEEEDESSVLPPLVLQFEPVVRMDDEQFFQFCALNQDVRIERSAEGEIILMYPEGSASGFGNAELAFLFVGWAKRDGTGRICGSSGGFTLPNKAVRAPDVSWTTKERLNQLEPRELERFAPICPDFVLELRSRTDSMRRLKAKMVEYLACGARMGWLIDPMNRTVFIYRPGKPVEELRDPKFISGESVLPGFTLTLSDLWEAIAVI